MLHIDEDIGSLSRIDKQIRLSAALTQWIQQQPSIREMDIVALLKELEVMAIVSEGEKAHHKDIVRAQKEIWGRTYSEVYAMLKKPADMAFWLMNAKRVRKLIDSEPPTDKGWFESLPGIVVRMLQDISGNYRGHWMMGDETYYSFAESIDYTGLTERIIELLKPVWHGREHLIANSGSKSSEASSEKKAKK